MSIPEALEEAGLADWAMEKRPLYSFVPATVVGGVEVEPSRFEVAPYLYGDVEVDKLAVLVEVES